MSLYRGMGPGMLLVSHGSIQFLAYEHAKQELSRRRADSSAASPSSKNVSAAAGSDEHAALNSRELMLASTSAKVCATLCTYPYQVIRSCMQQRASIGGDAVQYETMWQTISHTWRHDKIRGFYRGILPHILRSTPQATLTLLVYEYMQRSLNVCSGTG